MSNITDFALRTLRAGPDSIELMLKGGTGVGFHLGIHSQKGIDEVAMSLLRMAIEASDFSGDRGALIGRMAEEIEGAL